MSREDSEDGSWNAHSLKLPTTETERAFGAHTLKTAPDWPL